MKNRVRWAGRLCCALAMVWMTAQPATAQQVTYYFGQLAVGAGWQSTLTYINYSDGTVTCTTDFLSDSGSPLLLSFGGTTDSTRTDTLAARGSVHVQTTSDPAGPLTQGWARATCSAPVKASLLFRHFTAGGAADAEAGVNATTTPATEFVTFGQHQAGQPGTAVAYGNPSNGSALVTFAARNANGDVLATVDRTLASGAHGAENMSGLFGDQEFTGSLRVTSDVPIVSFALNAEAGAVVSSLPPGEIGPPAQAPFVYYLTHLALQGGWQTTLTYINISSQAVSCTTNFMDNANDPLLVSFGGTPTSSRTDNIPVGGSIHVETAADLNAPIVGGWATATCDGEVKASLLFRQYVDGVPKLEAGVNGTTTLTNHFVTFAELQEGKFGTAVALATGLPSFPIGCSIVAYDTAGQQIASSAALLFKPSSTLHTAFNLGGPGGAFTTTFAQEGITNFQGSIDILCNLPVVTSISINNEVEGVISSLPPGDLPAVVISP